MKLHDLKCWIRLKGALAKHGLIAHVSAILIAWKDWGRDLIKHEALNILNWKGTSNMSIDLKPKYQSFCPTMKLIVTDVYLHHNSNFERYIQVSKLGVSYSTLDNPNILQSRLQITSAKVTIMFGTQSVDCMQDQQAHCSDTSLFISWCMEVIQLQMMCSISFQSHWSTLIPILKGLRWRSCICLLPPLIPCARIIFTTIFLCRCRSSGLK